MGLGEIPARSTMRAYYHLENANDSSGNGRTLTNVGTVTFVAGKFGNAATMGTVAIDKGLMLSTNPMSALQFPNCTFSFWFKMNTVANTTVRVFTELSTISNSATGALTQISYTITAGVMTIQVVSLLTVTNSIATYALPVLPDTNTWYHLVGIKRTTTISDIYLNGKFVSTNTGSGIDTNLGNGRIYRLGIGQYSNTAGANCFATLDEYILEERVWSASEIKKYYTQAKGRYLTTQ